MESEPGLRVYVPLTSSQIDVSVPRAIGQVNGIIEFWAACPRLDLVDSHVCRVREDTMEASFQPLEEALLATVLVTNFHLDRQVLGD